MVDPGDPARRRNGKRATWAPACAEHKRHAYDPLEAQRQRRRDASRSRGQAKLAARRQLTIMDELTRAP